MPFDSLQQRYRAQLERFRSFRTRRRGEREALENAQHQVNPPSKLLYISLILFASCLDILDIFGDLSIIGMIVTYILKIFAFPILFIYGMRSGQKANTMNDIAKSLEEKIRHIRKKTYTYTRRTVIAAKIAKRIPGLKNLAAIVLDFIPFVDIIPWRLLGVFITYRDEKKTYESTQPVLDEFSQALNQTEIEDENINDSEYKEAIQ